MCMQKCKICVGVYLFYTIVLLLPYSKVNQLCMLTHPLLSGIPSHSSHHRALCGAPCADRRVSLVPSFIQSISGVYIRESQSPVSSQPLFPRWCPYVCTLCLCLCFCPGTRLIGTPFLLIDSTHISYILYLCFSFRHTSHSVTLCRPVHISAHGCIVFHCVCPGFLPGKSHE